MTKIEYSVKIDIDSVRSFFEEYTGQKVSEKEAVLMINEIKRSGFMQEAVDISITWCLKKFSSEIISDLKALQ